MGFLDFSGLSHFKDKIDVLFDEKQDKLTPDFCIEINDDKVISFKITDEAEEESF